MDKHQLREIGEAFLTFLSGLTPAAIGAAVSMVWDTGLTWTKAAMQLAVGIIVSFFAARALGAVWTLNPFVMQGIQFTLGMIAFKATPQFIDGAGEALHGLPSVLRDRLLSLLPGKGASK